MRARHLRAAAENAAFDRTRSWGARRRWACAVAAHVLVARGGEMGRVNGKPFTSARGLTWAHVQWHAAGELHEREACTVHLCSVKDGEGRGQRHPIPILRRAGGRQKGRSAASSDPLCAYSLLRAAWEEDARLLGESAARAAPVFRRTCRGGAEAAFETRDVAEIVRAVVTAAGDDPAEFGAHSARIGGASDYRDLVGDAVARRVLKVRGRWRGDIYQLYARSGVEESLAASAGVASVSTRDLESIFAGYTE